MEGHQGGFDKDNPLTKRSTQGRVVMANFVHIPTGVVLHPKLVGEIISRIFKNLEFRVEFDSLSHECSWIVNLSQLPSGFDQICLEEPLAARGRR